MVGSCSHRLFVVVNVARLVLNGLTWTIRLNILVALYDPYMYPFLLKFYFAMQAALFCCLKHVDVTVQTVHKARQLQL